MLSTLGPSSRGLGIDVAASVHSPGGVYHILTTVRLMVMTITIAMIE